MVFPVSLLSPTEACSRLYVSDCLALICNVLWGLQVRFWYDRAYPELTDAQSGYGQR